MAKSKDNKTAGENTLKKKKTNVSLYTILMTIVFIFITEVIIWRKGSNSILYAISYYPKGQLVLKEAILSALVLIVMILFGNSYVFTQKREKLRKGLYYGLYIIIFSALMILIQIPTIIRAFNNDMTTTMMTLINLLIGCFLVGVAEEFLCRGWLLNEFLERFGNNKKGVYESVWYSIIISGLIFGILHLANVYSNHDLVGTIIQVMNAAAGGVMYGLIYYKTRNIWSVVVLHALWDFSLFLNELSPTMSTVESYTIASVLGLIISLLMIGSELINIFPYTKNIDEEPKKKSVIILACASVFWYIIFLLANSAVTMNIGNEYKFDKITLNDYSVTYDNYSDYFIEYTNNVEVKGANHKSYIEKYLIKLSKNDKDNLVLTNLNTNYSVEIECDNLYDYIIMEEQDYYVLAYVDYQGNNPYFKYVYINKSELSNDNSLLDKIKNNIKLYVLPEVMDIQQYNDREKKISYVGVSDQDYGIYLLISEDKMARVE